MTAAVSFGTLLDFEAAFWQPDLVHRPLNLPPGRIEDFSGGLLSDPGIQKFAETASRFRYNQGIQTRYPGVACLPYVLKNQAAVGLGEDLVAYYDFEDASGNLLDNVGSNDLTETGGAVASVAGKVDNARDFSGGTAHFAGADAAVYDLAGDSTIAVWVKLASKAGDMAVFAKQDFAPGVQYSYRLFYRQLADRWRWSVSDDGDGATTEVDAETYGSPQIGQWALIVVRHRNGENIGISVNAGAENTAAHTTGIFDGTALFTVGAGNQGIGEWFGAPIDELGIWNRVLTDTEVAFLYNNGSGRAFVEVDTEDADVSGYNALGIRAHGIVSTAGGIRNMVGLGTKLYRANTVTGAMEVVPFTIDGGAVTSTFGGNATCVAQGIVDSTNSFVIALEGANDILYTTDVTASPIAFTTLKTTQAGDWIAAMRYLPTVGPGIWAIVGTLDGVSSVFSELGSTPADEWDPQQGTLEEFLDEEPTSPVSFTSPVLPTGVVNDASDGDVAWTNPGNAALDDGTRAVATLNTGQTSQWLRASFDLTGSVPAGNQVVGLLPRVEHQAGGSDSNEYEIQIRIAGTQVGVSRYPRTNISEAIKIVAFGAFDDPWFADLHGSDLADIEVWYRVQATSGTGDPEVDYFSLAVAHRPVSIERVIKTNRQPFRVTTSDLAITPSQRWQTPAEGMITDGVYALFESAGADQTSDYLIFGPFFVEGELPANGSFQDIQVDLYRGVDHVDTNAEDLVVQLLFEGSLVGFNQAVLAEEWNSGLTTISPRSYGPRWGISPLSGTQMARLYVAVRVLADERDTRIDGIVMHVAGTVPGMSSSFSGPDLGGIGSAGFGSVRNGWMVSPSPTDPEGLTIVAAGDMFRLSFGWDVESARMIFDFTKPNTGLAYVHHAAPYLGGYIVTGGTSIGVGDQVKVVGSNGDVIPWNFPLYHGDEEVRVNSLMVQGLWSIQDVIDADAGERQFWFANDQARYFPDTILQSLSENEAGNGRSSISATPIAWSTQPIYGPLNTIYSVFPNGTDTAWARQFLPPDLSSNPITTNATQIRSMAFDVDGVENTALYIETPDWDYGPPEANKTMNTLRHNDRLVSADASTYGTVVGSLATDGGTSFTALNTFDTAFERHRLATSGTAFRSFVLRLSLTHAAGTAKSPDALPWVFEADVQMPVTRHWTFLVDPDMVKPNLIDFMKAIATLMDSKTTQSLEVSTIRDGVNTTELGAVATIDSLSWSAPWQIPPFGELPVFPHDDKGNALDASSKRLYMLVGFSERIGTVT